MRGTLVRRTWEYDPARYAPPRFRRACHYEAFIPDDLFGFDEPITADLAGVVSDAETAVHRLNAQARPALAPLARLLLRTESIASSKVEGMQVYGPAPAPLAMLRARHRQRLLVHARRALDVQDVIREWLGALEWPRGVRVAVDVDPYSFL